MISGKIRRFIFLTGRKVGEIMKQSGGRVSTESVVGVKFCLTGGGMPSKREDSMCRFC